MYVLTVRELSLKCHALLDTRKSILVRNLMNVVSVKKPFLRSLTSLYITELIQGKNPINAVIVGKPSDIAQASVDIRGFINKKFPKRETNVGIPSTRICSYKKPSVEVKHYYVSNNLTKDKSINLFRKICSYASMEIIFQM